MTRPDSNTNADPNLVISEDVDLQFKSVVLDGGLILFIIGHKTCFNIEISISGKTVIFKILIISV
jgi:hypothetical protein